MCPFCGSVLGFGLPPTIINAPKSSTPPNGAPHALAGGLPTTWGGRQVLFVHPLPHSMPCGPAVPPAAPCT